MENVMKKLESLKMMRCIRSALSLGHITLSALSQDNSADASRVKAQIQEFLGDVHFEQSEFTISLGYFRQALVTASSVVTSRKVNENTNPQYKLKYKIGLCLVSLKDTFGALKELESIPIPRRDISTLMELGKLYTVCSMKRQAISAYKSVLTTANYVLEAVEALIELGVPMEEVNALCNSSGSNLNQNTAPANPANPMNASQKTASLDINANNNPCTTTLTTLTGNIFSPEWYKSLIALMSHRHVGDYSKCLEVFQGMKTLRVSPIVLPSSHLPGGTSHKDGNISEKVNNGATAFAPSDLTLCNNVHGNLFLLSEMAYISFVSDRLDDAYVLFKTIRRINPLYMYQMDYFGELLFHKNEETELNKLALDMLSLNNQSPVGWLVLALWSELKKETDKALAFVDKAIRCNPSYSNSVRLKGQIILHRKMPDKSLTCFYQANSLRKDVLSYIGIIEANLEAGTTRQAWKAAQEALESFPQCSSSLLVVGKALCKSEGKFEEGIHLIARVCRLNPTSKHAVSILAELYMAKGYFTEAITLLNNSLKHGSSSQLHLLVGKCLIATQRFGEASESLQTAMSLAAREGISQKSAAEEMERLESMLRQRQSANASNRHSSASANDEYEDSDMQEDAYEVEDEDVFQDVGEGQVDGSGNEMQGNTSGGDVDEAMMVTSNSRFLQDEFDQEAEFEGQGDVDEDEFHDLADQSFDFSISQQHLSFIPHNMSVGNGSQNMSAVSSRSAQPSGTSQFSQFTPPSQRRF